MKKSEIYLKAQVAILKAFDISNEDKLSVLKELMDREEICRTLEEKEDENYEKH